MRIFFEISKEAYFQPVSTINGLMLLIKGTKRTQQPQPRGNDAIITQLRENTTNILLGKY